jgi:hypothetical protein
MTTAMQIGETARDRADFCRCFKTGAAVFLHDDGIVAHSIYRNTLRAAYMLARTNCDTRGSSSQLNPNVSDISAQFQAGNVRDGLPNFKLGHRGPKQASTFWHTSGRWIISGNATVNAV